MWTIEDLTTNKASARESLVAPSVDGESYERLEWPEAFFVAADILFLLLSQGCPFASSDMNQLRVFSFEI